MTGQVVHAGGDKRSDCRHFDFPGLRIGPAGYPDDPTGVTVFQFPQQASGTLITRGGAPGSALTQALRASYGRYVSAIFFCGGSTYGLSGKQAETDGPTGYLTDSTTLTLVVTNRVLDQVELLRLAIETHSSMARAIQPFHTSRDRNALFAATTAECDADEPPLVDLSVRASELVWNAVLNSVRRPRISIQAKARLC